MPRKFDVDWDGAYKAWKQSNLSLREFSQSERLQGFIRSGKTPSKSTLCNYFKRIQSADVVAVVCPPQDEQQIAVEDPQTIRVIHVDSMSTDEVSEEVARHRPPIRRLRRVTVYLAKGHSIEFFSENPELFVFSLLCHSKGLPI